MQKKDYVLIAQWVSAMQAGVERHGNITLQCTFPQWVDRIADDLAARNSQFNRARFIQACGVTK